MMNYIKENKCFSISQRNNSEKEFSQINNQILSLSYSLDRNNLSKLQNNFVDPTQLNNENKANNLTINNNFLTQNIINNFNRNKNILNCKLSIYKFDFNINCNKSKMQLQIFKNSFQIIKSKKFNNNIKSTNNINFVKNGIKSINNKSKDQSNKNNDLLIMKNIKSHNNIKYTKTINKISNKKSENIQKQLIKFQIKKAKVIVVVVVV